MEENNIVKDIEIYMLAKFIDVLENIKELGKIEDIKEDIENRKESYNKEIEKVISKEDIFDIDEIDKTIDEKIEKYSKIYCKNKKYKEIESKIEKEKKEFMENIDKVEQIEDLIYKKCDYDVKCAYKIGFLEGLKLIALKDKI